MPILSGCCFCLDLRVGSLIIGVLNLINALINSLMFAILTIMMVFMNAGAKQTLREHDAAVFNEDEDYPAVQENEKQILEIIIAHIDLVTIALYILLGVSLLCVITSSMLIHGVRNKRRGLLLPFIVQEVINIIVFIGLMIGALVGLGTHYIIVSGVMGVVGGMLIHIYCMLVIISQYQALGLIRMHEEISMK